MLGLSVEQCACLVFLVVLAACSGFTNAMPRSRSVSEVPPRLRHRRSCPRIDAAWKAYRAGTVALATAQSLSTDCRNASRDECQVLFTVLKWYKREPPASAARDSGELIPLRLHKNNTSKYCEYDNFATRAKPLVRTKIENSQQYILFLNTSGPHKFSAAFVPERYTSKMERAIVKVTNDNFTPKPVRINESACHARHRKYTCRVEGFPLPTVQWKHNNTILHNRDRVRIIQKKRKSILVVDKRSDTGQYTCVAIAATGEEVSYVVRRNSSPSKSKTHNSKHKMHSTSRPKTHRIFRPNTHTTSGPLQTPGTYTSDIDLATPAPDREPCKEDMRENFCHNGGTCFATRITGGKVPNSYDCVCPPGYTGHRCEGKMSDQSSRYRQTPIFTCKIGLFTKYDDC
ncbi:uncharacterized protein LOC103313241 isoform X3 [Tribolium castaneum]|uniref:uncharacterized protein LOC103313241 isoform X3 n=1 Tax=Tribolium castaneum TaxID=7070 RepID=UPI00046C22C3|nr:PREDICTED: uncharacterized protein LOC103313241 isoform X3 [Tribolium castaneum]|eukprot:XP_008194226.1 PREDICTED: uncharacterized protein LOC103313241 isoform X3 [Tribolium castaneum]